MVIDALSRIAKSHGLSDDVVAEIAEAVRASDVSDASKTVAVPAPADLPERSQDRATSGTLFVTPAMSAERELSPTPVAGAPTTDAAALVDAATAEPVPVRPAPSPRPRVPVNARTPAPSVEAFRPPADPTADFELRANRFEDLGLIGVGSMGEVRRVLDPALNRVMAMKTIRPELMKRPRSVARFVEEAQATAQLQHPGILPVFELGRTPDGRLYFTMQEVRGKTLSQVMADVHDASYPGRWRESATGWTFNRLIGAFQRACEAVAYAHTRGVVHRDLKPDNIMVGEHGEVLVLDWGLAKVLRETSASDTLPIDIPGRRSGRATSFGTVAGTPLYMPPEQARGDIDRIGPHSDVYALGAMLYEILTGSTPYRGETATEVLDQVVAGPPEPLPTQPSDTDIALGRGSGSYEFGSKGPIPPELAVACNRAMERAIRDRYSDATELSHEVADWLEGARKRDKALEIVAAARERQPLASRLRRHAEGLRIEARERLAAVPAWADEDRKKEAWEQLDRADDLEARAAQEELAAELLLHGALTHHPGLPEAHLELARRYQAEHRAAEEARNVVAASRAEHRLRVHAQALREDVPQRSEIEAYLAGTGAVSLRTEPHADVTLFRYVRKNRRLVPEFVRTLGVTPLRGIELPMGSYLLELRAPGHETVRYPVRVGRQQHVHTIAPGEARPRVITLPPAGSLADDEVYVPCGWFSAGGDPDAPNALPGQRVWAEAFVIKRFVVTNREYLGFLNDLVDRGDSADALRFTPRERAAGGEELGALIYGRDENGRFFLQPDGDGDVWDPDYPVIMIDHVGATAYAAWLAERSGLPWRLPHELEWEKAARGADGRFHPWGDAMDPSWCHMRASHQAGPTIARVETNPIDESPYGVRGLAGNVSEWCANVYTDEGQNRDGLAIELVEADDPAAFRVDKSGGWYDTEEYVRSAVRRGLTPNTRRSDVGFRLVRSVE